MEHSDQHGLHPTIGRAERTEDTSLILQVGDIIQVQNLEVQTPIGKEIYSGPLEVTGIREKGEASTLRMKGKSFDPYPDRYYTFKYSFIDSYGLTQHFSVTASQSALEENQRLT